MLNLERPTFHRLLVSELYERILGVAFWHAPHACEFSILLIVCAESRIDVSVLANLTNTDLDTVQKVVDSIIWCPFRFQGPCFFSES